ncbi:hypothetical protein DMN91_005606 [Ooceraea biroi]|uniref:CCHC-type domain-containing protein n=1 Tax=Ooceraea biroi TaxID=2015173 RepID=A0A3L8DLZ1_OOCBI|nr:hypothetical protein DMN91_005606 [Ooceraea biroi]
MSTPRSPREQTPTAAGTDALATILAELQQRADVEGRLERMEQHFTELSSLNNIPSCARERAGANADAGSGGTASAGVVVSANADTEVRGLKLKPDVFDGSVPLKEFLAQFALIARANAWNDAAKAMALASCLRGRARAVLSALENPEQFSFAELQSKLELRFGEGIHAQDYYLQFTNRRQDAGEDFPTLGADLERLSRLAYPECSVDVCDKIACSQFVAALTDGYTKRTLQLEGITSLRTAIERAKTMKTINENSFVKKKEGSGERRRGNGDAGKESKFKRKEGNEKKSEKECWQCSAKGHFRAECPALEKEN